MSFYPVFPLNWNSGTKPHRPEEGSLKAVIIGPIHWNRGTFRGRGRGWIAGDAMCPPRTGAVSIFELTHDLNVLPGLFIGSVAAFGDTVLVLRRSVL